MTGIDYRKMNRTSLLLILAGLLLTCALLAAPLYTVRSDIFTKKSSNTFVGDEKYQEVKAEVDAVVQEYRSQGLDVEPEEEVTERINSKGEKTSLITFRVVQAFKRNAFSFLNSGLPSGSTLRVMLGLMLAGVLFSLVGCVGSMALSPREQKIGTRCLRSLGACCMLAAAAAVPVFILQNNYLFWRKVSLYNQDLLTEGKEAFTAALDRYLFEGRMGEDIDAALRHLEVDHSPLLWVLIPCLLIAFTGAVRLRRAAVKRTLLKILLYVFVIVVCVVTLYPYYVMFVTAFRSNAETLDMYFLNMLPVKWVWSNLQDILGRGVLQYLANSLMIALGATALAMLCGIPAAYAMARMNFKGKKAFLGFVIMSQMFSPVVLLIGISQLMNTFHLNDTIPGLIFINAAFNQAFAIWLLRGTFVAISPEMEQAARIDGCGTLGSLIRILLPMAAPGIVTTLIFVFINAWNEYTISTVLISTAAKRPITVGITQFSSFNMIEWQYLFAASLLATAPVVVMFMFIEKHLTSGLTSGGVKG